MKDIVINWKNLSYFRKCKYLFGIPVIGKTDNAVALLCIGQMYDMRVSWGYHIIEINN